MNKKLWIIPLLLFVVILTACGGSEETATPEATMVPTATMVAEEETIELQPVSVVPIEEIQNIIWLWTGLVETQPANLSLIPDPENYTLTLNPDNTYFSKADCNSISGGYQVDGSFLTLMPGPTTLVACEEGSLFDQYSALLGQVESFGLRDSLLVLTLKDGAGEMQFVSGGIAEAEPTPTPGVCDAGIDPETVSLDTEGLYEDYLAECVLLTAFDETQAPGPKGLPDHIQILFNTDEAQEPDPNAPIIYIIPVADYIAMWSASGNESIATSIQSLQNLLETKPEPIPTSGIPVLPFEEVMGVPDIQVQGKYLTTEMGEGIRFVSRFSQGPNPVTSDNPPLFYIFQGFSSDGQYLISYFNPVTTEALPAAAEVSEEEQQQVEQDMQAYLDTKAAELNALNSADWQPNLDTLDALIESLRWGEEPEVTQPTGNTLLNINWLWTSLVETNPPAQSVVPTPDNYTLVLYSNGSLTYRADCNTGSGSYKINGNQMTITLGVSTQVACPAGSLSDQYTGLLSSVASYGFESGSLILGLSDDAGTMGFVNGGSVIDTTPPGTGVPTATTTEPLNVRSGPGTQYYSYGIVPAGTTLEVVGKNTEGTWWAVNIPTTLTTTGVGWVSGDYVDLENVNNVPVLSNPPNVTPTPTSGPSPTPGATGTPTVTATSAATSPLPGSSWALSSMNGQAPISGTSLTLAFGSSTVSGSGGCNNFNGSYTQSGSTINIGQLAVSGVVCGTDIDQQEQTYFNLLQSANSYQIVGNQLVLFVNGAEVLRFN